MFGKHFYMILPIFQPLSWNASWYDPQTIFGTSMLDLWPSSSIFLKCDTARSCDTCILCSILQLPSMLHIPRIVLDKMQNNYVFGKEKSVFAKNFWNRVVCRRAMYVSAGMMLVGNSLLTEGPSSPVGRSWSRQLTQVICFLFHNDLVKWVKYKRDLQALYRLEGLRLSFRKCLWTDENGPQIAWAAAFSLFHVSKESLLWNSSYLCL